jgi:lycopene cyclase domain-containing protein
VNLDHWRYAAALAGCLVVTLPLELVLGARVYRRPRRLLLTLLPVLAAFVAWDVLATRHGSWGFAPEYTLGPSLLGLPVEEWLFFVVVPVCGLLTYEAVGSTAHTVRRRARAVAERRREAAGAR